mgnify:FL=1
MHLDGEEEIKYVSGTIYSYSFLCMRKVWLSYHNLSMEQESELVEVGKLIDETTYKNERHNFLIDNIVNIDFLKKNIVHEVKKSSKEKQMAINQIKYYLFILKNHGFEDIKGRLDVPKSKYTEEVILTEEDIKNIKSNLERIDKILKSKNIPEPINEKSCLKCAYYELCYI